MVFSQIWYSSMVFSTSRYSLRVFRSFICCSELMLLKCVLLVLFLSLYGYFLGYYSCVCTEKIWLINAKCYDFLWSVF